jgi:hypothetical protein
MMWAWRDLSAIGGSASGGNSTLPNIVFVGIERLELSRTYVHTHLKRTCIPIPPYPQNWYYFKLYLLMKNGEG